MIVMFIDMMIIVIEFAIELQGIEMRKSIDLTCTAVYAITDCTLAVGTMFLFFRPICDTRFRDPNTQDNEGSIVIKYGIVSALQCTAAVFYEMAVLGRVYVIMMHASIDVWKGYVDIINIIQMLDCLMLLICLYVGFARKRTVCI